MHWNVVILAEMLEAPAQTRMQQNGRGGRGNTRGSAGWKVQHGPEWRRVSFILERGWGVEWSEGAARAEALVENPVRPRMVLAIENVRR